MYKRLVQIFALLGLVGCALPVLRPFLVSAHAQALGGSILPVGRNASSNWKMAGMLSVGGIPARTTTCKTVSPLGGGKDDTTNIQNAINGCPAGQTVALASGTFTIAEGNYVQINSAI